ncbi:MAG TPA: YceI family protein [Bacteroidia bacterium]|jgi:polyisoprenoid-binding protein YceI|nr:YceI family protein [Bacteroidia bacterium]
METTNWVLDPTHSEVQFKVKHLMITHVTGSFNVLSANVHADENFNHAKVSFTADTSSVNTGNEQRDGHLKGADFFDSAKFPAITFESTDYNAKEGKIKGNLTIKGVTKPVNLEAEFNGINKDPWGNHKAGFSVSGKINRKDWGLEWNAALEGGGVLVSEEVKINAEVQFVKKA